MKIRLGFVSNSSSSSFICALCNEAESGIFDMVCCEKGHEVHIRCLPDPDKVRKILDDAEEKADSENYKDENGKSYDEYRYELPSKYCPICNFEAATDKDLMKYLLKSSGKTAKEIVAEIKTKFETYDKFKEYLR